jgi:hypothetical protein
MCRMMFGLREIRCSLAAIPPAPPSDEPTMINIVTEPVGNYIRQLNEISSTGPQLVIEHMIDPNPAFEQANNAPEPIPEIEPELVVEPPSIVAEPPPPIERARPVAIADDEAGVFVVRAPSRLIPPKGPRFPH